jgi:dTDP-4-amino-4,6-dideoxygalactose transaminase
MGGNELEYVKEAFESNWLAPLGPNVDGFEASISKYLSTSEMKPSVAALSSGTAAIHLGLQILGVGLGDYVLCQSFTFCGTVNPVAYLGAQPVFIDSEKETWNMCPLALEDAIKHLLSLNINSEKIKAIIPVHLYGMPCKMKEIDAVSKKYSIPILEDAAEALGSFYYSQACGSLGEISALSFNGNKIITTSGGGAIVSHSVNHIKNAKFLSTQARDEAPYYQHTKVGYNYRLSNVLAGIGRGQMECLNERVKARRLNNTRYRGYFKGIEGISFQDEPNDSFFSNYWLTCILVDPKFTGGITNEQIRLSLLEANIEARPLWKPMHLQPVFKNSHYSGGDVCEGFFENGLCLPSGSNLTDSDFERIFDKLDSLFHKS